MALTGVPNSVARILPTSLTRPAETRVLPADAAIDSFVGQEINLDINIPAATAAYAGEAFVVGFREVFDAPMKLVDRACVQAEIAQTPLIKSLGVGAQVICAPLSIPAALIYGAGNSVAALTRLMMMADS